jgi:hypothetical protein
MIVLGSGKFPKFGRKLFPPSDGPPVKGIGFDDGPVAFPSTSNLPPL